MTERDLVKYMKSLREHFELIVPEHMFESLIDYVTIGCPQGDFLQAVLSNDLVEAFNRADEINMARMRDWACVLYKLPRQSWGSPTAVSDWMAHKGMQAYLDPPEDPNHRFWGDWVEEAAAANGIDQ